MRKTLDRIPPRGPYSPGAEKTNPVSHGHGVSVHLLQTASLWRDLRTGSTRGKPGSPRHQCGSAELGTSKE